MRNVNICNLEISLLQDQECNPLKLPMRENKQQQDVGYDFFIKINFTFAILNMKFSNYATVMSPLLPIVWK